MKRNETLQSFVNNFTKENFGRDLSTSQKQKICVVCGEPIKEFRDDLSKREYEISGLCQECQDEVFGG
jgi:uncharacterized CHY-type Zn-finger protein